MENVAFAFLFQGTKNEKNSIKERIRAKKRDRRRVLVIDSERFEAKPNSLTACLLSVFQGFELKLFASSSEGRYEEMRVKLAKLHSRLGLLCSSRGTPLAPPTFV